jgi:hypothetical protein
VSTERDSPLPFPAVTSGGERASRHLEPGDRPVTGFPKAGGWTSPHVRHRRAARYLLADLRALLREADERRAKASSPAEARLIGRIDELGERIHTLAEGVELFAAMAVEAILNLYGVVALGEKYYKRHLERLNPGKKVAALLLGCEGVIVGDDSEILLLVERIYNRRNRLVHPKSHEMMTPEQEARIEMAKIPDDAEVTVRDMERFFELLGQYNWQMRSLGMV